MVFMDIDNFKRLLLSKNQWDFPIDLSTIDAKPSRIATVLITLGHSVAIQPVFLKNILIFKNLSNDEWKEVITNSFLEEDKHMMGMINFVDTCYKYLKVDLRPLLLSIDKLDVKKRDFVIEYYEDCPFCLAIEDWERDDIFKKYEVDVTDLEIFQKTLTVLQ